MARFKGYLNWLKRRIVYILRGTWQNAPIAENGAFELLYGWGKSLPYLQKAVRPDL